MLLLEALGTFRYNGDTLPHPLPQALPPLVRNHSNNADGEAVRRRAVGVAHGQAGEDPDVARPQQTHLGRVTEQVLRLFVGAICQQDPRIQLQTEKGVCLWKLSEQREESLNTQHYCGSSVTGGTGCSSLQIRAHLLSFC